MQSRFCVTTYLPGFFGANRIVSFDITISFQRKERFDSNEVAITIFERNLKWHGFCSERRFQILDDIAVEEWAVHLAQGKNALDSIFLAVLELMTDKI